MIISCSPAEKKRALFFEFRTIIPLENHCFGDRPFLPFEVGRARAIALISLAWLKLTTWFGGGSAVDEPIFAVLNQLANVNGLKGQLINLASTLTTNGALFKGDKKIKTSHFKRSQHHREHPGHGTQWCCAGRPRSFWGEKGRQSFSDEKRLDCFETSTDWHL